MARITWAPTVPTKPQAAGEPGTPAGYIRVALPPDAPEGAYSAWSNEAQVVILGDPRADDEGHNCDAMGCRQEHVLEIREVVA